MAFKFPKNPFFKNKTETVSSVPHSIPVELKRPPSLEETVRRALRQELAKRESPKIDNDPLDLSINEADEFGESPHEIVEDLSGMEVTRAEKAWLDAQRSQFENVAKARKAAAIEKKKAAAKAKFDAPPAPEKKADQQ